MTRVHGRFSECSIRTVCSEHGYCTRRDSDRVQRALNCRRIERRYAYFPFLQESFIAQFRSGSQEFVPHGAVHRDGDSCPKLAREISERNGP